MKMEMHLCIDVLPVDLDIVRVWFSRTLHRLKKTTHAPEPKRSRNAVARRFPQNVSSTKFVYRKRQSSL